MKKTKMRGITDRQLATILDQHTVALAEVLTRVNAHSEALRWLLKRAGHPGFQDEGPVIEGEAVAEPEAVTTPDPAPSTCCFPWDGVHAVDCPTTSTRAEVFTESPKIAIDWASPEVDFADAAPIDTLDV